MLFIFGPSGCGKMQALSILSAKCEKSIHEMNPLINEEVNP